MGGPPPPGNQWRLSFHAPISDRAKCIHRATIMYRFQRRLPLAESTCLSVASWTWFLRKTQVRTICLPTPTPPTSSTRILLCVVIRGESGKQRLSFPRTDGFLRCRTSPSKANTSIGWDPDKITSEHGHMIYSNTKKIISTAFNDDSVLPRRETTSALRHFRTLFMLSQSLCHSSARWS